MNGSARHRRHLADRVAKQLLTAPVEQVWLEGALTCGFAHAASDIDLRVIVDADDPPRWESRVVEGVRIDARPDTSQHVAALRRLLHGFEVRRGDLALFRQVRAAMPDLTLLRTALSCTGEGWQPVLTPQEREGYRRWAVADRAEAAASLAEDLTGLLGERMRISAEIVCRRLTLCLAALEAAAAGDPVLGDKWLPYLGSSDGPADLPAVPYDRHGADDWAWFRPVQLRVALALLRCWPTEAGPGSRPDIEEPTAGWLPQRYTDGWFLRRSDCHHPVSEATLLAWLTEVSPTLQ